MFISCEFIDSSVKGYEYKIIDTEFEDHVIFDATGLLSGCFMPSAVIETYERRNLPIVSNLMRAFISMTKIYDYSIQELIDCNRHSDRFAKYDNDIRKLLLLL